MSTKFFSIISRKAAVANANSQLVGFLNKEAGSSADTSAFSEDFLEIISETTKNSQLAIINKFKADIQNLKKRKIELLEMYSGCESTDPLNPKYNSDALVKELHNISMSMRNTELSLDVANDILKEYFTESSETSKN